MESRHDAAVSGGRFCPERGCAFGCVSWMVAAEPWRSARAAAALSPAARSGAGIAEPNSFSPRCERGEGAGP